MAIKTIHGNFGSLKLDHVICGDLELPILEGLGG